MIEIHINQQVYFRLLRKLNTSVHGLTKFPLSEIADTLLGPSKRKKLAQTKIEQKKQQKSSKKLPVIEISKPILEENNLSL